MSRRDPACDRFLVAVPFGEPLRLVEYTDAGGVYHCETLCEGCYEMFCEENQRD